MIIHYQDYYNFKSLKNTSIESRKRSTQQQFLKHIWAKILQRYQNLSSGIKNFK